jgi:MoaA/NifB/PqqE/SkfB family radical SAM enzyme
MISYHDIKHIHLEISSLCNARCPLCPRNFHGYPYNDGYVERNLTLEDVKKIFEPNFVKQLTGMLINGNFGDCVMNTETPDIIEYFKTHSPNIKIDISTNGGARSKQFWQRLAKLDVRVLFALDGLADTHSIYRQDTVYETVLRNAQTFIKAGGSAVWKMIPFDHNQHQIDECRSLSKKLGFSKFILTDQGRDTGVAVDKKGNVVNVIGKPKVINFDRLLESKKTDEVLLEDLDPVVKNITCQVKKSKSIYVTSTGEVYPCCYTGFYPRTYGHGQYYQVVNKQLRDIIEPNNALETSLQESITWFNSVEESWSNKDFDNGRLVVCNDVCGS